MDDLNKNIKKSAKKICRLFLGSRLYLRKTNMSENDDILGVNLLMDFDGRKRISLFMERKAVKSVMQKFIGDTGGTGDDIAYDVVSEMANMITGNALSKCKKDIRISTPNRATLRCIDKNTINFSSDIGRLSILIEDMQ